MLHEMEDAEFLRYVVSKPLDAVNALEFMRLWNLANRAEGLARDGERERLARRAVDEALRDARSRVVALERNYATLRRLADIDRVAHAGLDAENEALRHATPADCPTCGSKKRDARAVVTLRPLASCRDPWHDGGNSQ